MVDWGAGAYEGTAAELAPVAERAEGLAVVFREGDLHALPVEAAGVAEELREAMAAVLRAADEDPDAFLVHSPYVVHELRGS